MQRALAALALRPETGEVDLVGRGEVEVFLVQFGETAEFAAGETDGSVWVGEGKKGGGEGLDSA